MSTTGNKVITQAQLVREALEKGLTTYESIKQYVFDRCGKTPSGGNIYLIRKAWRIANRRSRGSANSNVVSPAIRGSSDNQKQDQHQSQSSPSPAVITPVVADDTAAGGLPPSGPLIEGTGFSIDSGEATEQPESEELSKSFQKQSGGAPIGGAIGSGGLPEQLRVETPGAIPQQEEGVAVDLTMFSSMPAIMTDVMFHVPQMQKATGNYEVEDKDLAAITTHTEVLLRKYGGEIVTKWAEELNFIGAMMVPWIKAFAKKIAEAAAHLGRKKEDAKKKKESELLDTVVKQEQDEQSVPQVQQQTETSKPSYRDKIMQINKTVSKEQEP